MSGRSRFWRPTRGASPPGFWPVGLLRTRIGRTTPGRLLEIACRDADFSTVRHLVETSPPAVRSGAADLLDDAFGPCRGDDAAGWLFAEARRSWDDPDRADRLGCRAVASALADLDPTAILKTLDTLMEAP